MGAGALTLMEARGVSCFYGRKQAVKQVSVDIHKGEILAFIGKGKRPLCLPAVDGKH